MKFHAYSLKQFNLQYVKPDGTTSGQKLLVNPFALPKTVGKVGFVLSLTHAGSLCLTHQAMTMAVRKVNVSASESVLSTTYIETCVGC